MPRMILQVALGLLLVAVDPSLAGLKVTNHWNGGFEGDLCIHFDNTVEHWDAKVVFSQDVWKVECWDATPHKVSNREYTMSNLNWNGHQNGGSNLCFHIVGRGAENPTAQVSVGGSSGGTQTGGSSAGNPPDTPTNTGGTSGKKDYGVALGKSILFYDAQRSGKLPANNPISWRGDSALGDCVVGGWYDAGDHVKFGLPMASSAHLLVWGAIKFKDGYVKAGQMDMLYDSVKWALDYFKNAWNAGTQELVAQIGDGNADHAFWGRPEDMTMNRPCLKINSGNKGSDIAGETVAALAAGAVLFKDKDPAYSAQLISKAKSLYAFAKAHRGVFHGSAPFYGSSGDKDEMCNGGVWLYRATKDVQYLNDAKANADTGTGWALSWDDKRVACQILLYEETKDGAQKTAIESFFKSWLPGGGMTYTPCGLAWRDRWGANRYAGGASFAALIAAEDGIMSAQLRPWAVQQINYLLGDNNHDGGCFSFEIGYGAKFPRHPHHRGASVTGKTLQGALVGGPDSNDNYNDSQDDFVMNEVATDYNSGFQGALAGIVHLQETGNFPATTNKCPCK